MKPPYVPPILGARLSPAAATILEAPVPIPADFDARFAAGAPSTSLGLDLGGFRLGLHTDATVARYIRETLSAQLAPQTEDQDAQLTVTSLAKLPLEAPITRIAAEERDGVMRAMNRGMALRADLLSRRVEALVEQRALRQDVSNLLRTVLWIYGPERGRVLFHTAVIEHRNEACLFFGQATAGKTTVARLSPGRDVLTDDATLLSFTGERLEASGVGLWGGETDDAPSRRWQLPVRAFFSLRKAATTRLVKLSAAKAALEWTSVVPVILRDAARNRRILDFALRAVAAAPLYELHFRWDDQTFWKLLEEELWG